MKRSKRTVGGLGAILAAAMIVSATSQGRADDASAQTPAQKAVIAQVAAAIRQADQRCQTSAAVDTLKGKIVVCDQVSVPKFSSGKPDIDAEKGPYFRVIDPQDLVIKAGIVELPSGKACTTPNPDKNFVDCPTISEADIRVDVPYAKEVTWEKPNPELTNYPKNETFGEPSRSFGYHRDSYFSPALHEALGTLNCSPGSHVRFSPQNNAPDHALTMDMYSFQNPDGDLFTSCSFETIAQAKKEGHLKDTLNTYSCVNPYLPSPELTRVHTGYITYTSPPNTSNVPFYATCVPNKMGK